MDLDLAARADGSVAPAAHPEGLVLGGKGGSRPASLKAAGKAAARTLVTLGQGQEQVELQWKGDLPTPVLDGPKATYRDAVPGADVVVEATRSGFEQYVTIKQRPSAGGYAYTMPLRAKGLKAAQQADGSVVFTDAKSGKKRAVIPAPMMWDATVDPVSGEHTHRAKVALKVVQHGSNIELLFTPDAAFLADKATKFPVTVDPSTTALSNVFDTYGQQGETVDWSADTSYTDADGATTTTKHDALDRPTVVTDSVPSTTNYTYDTGIDPRGLATSVTDSVASAFSARYDADGTVASQGLPGGYTVEQDPDPAGTPVTRTYTRDDTGTDAVCTTRSPAPSITR